MKKFKKIIRLPDFDKDMKKLIRRFKTLEGDLKIFIDKQLFLYHKLKVDNKGIKQLSGSNIENSKIYKVKKFACRSLRGKGVQSGIRVIYGYYEEIDKIELIEIYYKGDKRNEDKGRIEKYYR